jgi:hypothetical protein
MMTQQRHPSTALAPEGNVCEDCHQNMLTADSCTVDEIEADDGTVYRRIPYGHEADGYGFPLPERCHDCGVAHGGYHHMGCDMEICPHCGNQMLGCDFDPARRVEDALTTALAGQHHHVVVRVGDMEAWIDEGIAPLVRACWKLGIMTLQSCQDNEGRAYIQFPDGGAAARFVREAQDVRDADLRARILHWPWATPRKKELDATLDEPEWTTSGQGWAEWWEQTWDYDTTIQAQPAEDHPLLMFPVTVRFPVTDLGAVTRQLQKAARSKGRAR